MVTNSRRASSLRTHHRSLVLRLIAAESPSRVRIAEATGLSGMGVTRIVTELVDAGLVFESGKIAGREGPGRQRKSLAIQPDGAFVFGVTISSFSNEVTCIDAAGGIRAAIDLTLTDPTDADEVIGAIADTVAKLTRKLALPDSRILGIGVAVSGIVHGATGRVRRASYLGWQDVDFGRDLGRRSALPVVVENLANAWNVSERRFGCAKGNDDVLLVSGGTTCGASLTKDGELVRGAAFEAGQLGHVHVGRGDLQCSCGRYDCLNTVASGWSILVRSGRVSEPRFDVASTPRYARELTALLDEDTDAATRNLLAEAGRHLAHAGSDACLLVDPALVLVAGALTRSSAFTEAFRSEWAQSRLASIKAALPPLAVSHAPPPGATAHLALDAFLFSDRLDPAQVCNADTEQRHG